MRAYCGRPKRQSEGTCRRPAGWGTDHPGVGACKLHGGKNPIKHGRYSTIRREALGELIEKHEADPDPLNVLPELAAARALFEDYVNRYDQWRDALFAWYESWSERQRPVSSALAESMRNVLDDYEEMTAQRELTERQDNDIEAARAFVDYLTDPDAAPRPRRMLDLADAIDFASTITKIVERIERIRSANAISRPSLYRLMGEMGRVVEHHNREPDPDRRLQKIRDDWLGIRVS